MSGDLPDDPGDILVAVAGDDVPPSFPFAMPRSATGAEIAQFVALRAAACVGADYSNLALLDPAETSMLRLYHGPFLDASVADRYVDIPVDSPFPITAAIRDERIIVLDGPDAYAQQFPDILEDTLAAGIQATVSVPLMRSDGSLIGAMGFAWASSPSFDFKLAKALRAVSHLVSEIVERAELYEAEHQLIADLHLRLVSALPSVEGVRTAARYMPAGLSTAVGGDWFEGLVLDDGTFAVVVGDVTGHGLAAAADMALIRGLITSLLHDGVPVGSVFARVSSVLRRRPEDLLATAAVAVVDVSRSLITYATAGHPPPLLALPDGSVLRLDRANAPMLGVATTLQAADIVPFPAGARLLMYTDGLVERRDRPFSVGIDCAVELLESCGAGTPDELIDMLLNKLIGENTGHDDIAVVVVENNS